MVHELRADAAAVDDVGAIVAMLADDPLGSKRERLEDPAAGRPMSRLSRRVEAAPHLHLVVAEDGDGRRGRLPAALHSPGVEFAREPRAA